MNRTFFGHVVLEINLLHQDRYFHQSILHSDHILNDVLSTIPHTNVAKQIEIDLNDRAKAGLEHFRNTRF